MVVINRIVGIVRTVQSRVLVGFNRRVASSPVEARVGVHLPATKVVLKVAVDRNVLFYSGYCREIKTCIGISGILS